MSAWYASRFTTPAVGRRGYHHSAGGEGATSSNPDGLVYSMMANLQGRVRHGPECFYREDDDEEGEAGKMRDLRDALPLKLDRPWLLRTASDIRTRLQVLCGDIDHTDEYQTILKLTELLDRLGNLLDDDPKLELRDYQELWDVPKKAFAASNELPITTLSVAEINELTRLMIIGQVVFRMAAMNAVFRGLKGERSEDEHGFQAANDDYRDVALNIYGGLLDGKDYFPKKRWFEKEEDVRMLEAINKLKSEARRRGVYWG
ncbi:hypothetical protein CC78DRAFT_536631 [Lojkania enalia]|uniref:Uncharacterized protein n=1 Tax=Lojkania enalia TaxID=147567 RepID=A0A9P4K1A3_9PLEO|nr:hypothetical protein CC78DRAFT_536631 [Didymosphaeria enalia]